MAQTTFDICTECGEETEVTVVDEVTRLCEDCLDELDYIECEHCHEYWQYDAVTFYSTKKHIVICEHCVEMLLDDGELSEDDIEEIDEFGTV